METNTTQYLTELRIPRGDNCRFSDLFDCFSSSFLFILRKELIFFFFVKDELYFFFEILLANFNVSSSVVFKNILGKEKLLMDEIVRADRYHIIPEVEVAKFDRKKSVYCLNKNGLWSLMLSSSSNPAIKRIQDACKSAMFPPSICSCFATERIDDSVRKVIKLDKCTQAEEEKECTASFDIPFPTNSENVENVGPAVPSFPSNDLKDEIEVIEPCDEVIVPVVDEVLLRNLLNPNIGLTKQQRLLMATQGLKYLQSIVLNRTSRECEENGFRFFYRARRDLMDDMIKEINTHLKIDINSNKEDLVLFLECLLNTLSGKRYYSDTKKMELVLKDLLVDSNISCLSNCLYLLRKEVTKSISSYLSSPELTSVFLEVTEMKRDKFVQGRSLLNHHGNSTIKAMLPHVLFPGKTEKTNIFFPNIFCGKSKVAKYIAKSTEHVVQRYSNAFPMDKNDKTTPLEVCLTEKGLLEEIGELFLDFKKEVFNEAKEAGTLRWILVKKEEYYDKLHLMNPVFVEDYSDNCDMFENVLNKQSGSSFLENKIHLELNETNNGENEYVKVRSFTGSIRLGIDGTPVTSEVSDGDLVSHGTAPFIGRKSRLLFNSILFGVKQVGESGDEIRASLKKWLPALIGLEKCGVIIHGFLFFLEYGLPIDAACESKLTGVSLKSELKCCRCNHNGLNESFSGEFFNKSTGLLEKRDNYFDKREEIKSMDLIERFRNGMQANPYLCPELPVEKLKGDVLHSKLNMAQDSLESIVGAAHELQRKVGIAAVWEFCENKGFSKVCRHILQDMKVRKQKEVVKKTEVVRGNKKKNVESNQSVKEISFSDVVSGNLVEEEIKRFEGENFSVEDLKMFFDISNPFFEKKNIVKDMKENYLRILLRFALMLDLKWDTFGKLKEVQEAVKICNSEGVISKIQGILNSRPSINCDITNVPEEGKGHIRILGKESGFFWEKMQNIGNLLSFSKEKIDAARRIGVAFEIMMLWRPCKEDVDFIKENFVKDVKNFSSNFAHRNIWIHKLCTHMFDLFMKENTLGKENTELLEGCNKWLKSTLLNFTNHKRREKKNCFVQCIQKWAFKRIVNRTVLADLYQEKQKDKYTEALCLKFLRGHDQLDGGENEESDSDDSDGEEND